MSTAEVTDTRFSLSQADIPSAWFNVAPHLSSPLDPPLHPVTREPVGPADLAPLFAEELIGQEMSADPWIDIPGEVLDVLRLWRPTPLVRARRLEAALGTPARIYFKDESVSPAGSHKPNSAVPQAFYNAREGITRLATETGAGPVGHRAVVRVRAVRPGVRRLHGAQELRAEALPQGDHGDLGRHRRPVPDRRPRQRRLARRRDLRRRPRRGRPRGHPLRARLGAQPRAAAPDGHRPRGQAAARDGGGEPARRRDRALRRRVEPRRDRAAVRARPGGPPARGRAAVVPDADRRAPTSTTSATPPG